MTTHQNDSRYKDKSSKLLKEMIFPKILDEKLDISKVNLDVMRPWVTEKVIEILGFEDEICAGLVIGLLEEKVAYFVLPFRLMGNKFSFN